MPFTRRFLQLAMITIMGSVATPLVTAFSSRMMATGVERGPFTPLPWLLGAGALLVFAGFLLTRALRQLSTQLDGAFFQQAEFLDTLPVRWVDLSIVGTAALSLFLELTVIRWQGTVFEFFAFYKNFSLLCCFAGLGLGYALAGRDRIPLAAVTPLLVWQFAFLIAFRHGMTPRDLTSVSSLPFREQLNMGVATASTLAEGIATYFFLTVTFMMTALAFIPLGQGCGRLMKRQSNLRAYGLNLIGSLVGITLTVIASSLWTPPAVWYALAFGGVVLLLPRVGKSLVTSVSFATAGLMMLASPIEPLLATIYSPYQILKVGHTSRGLMEIQAAGQYYQRVHKLSGVATLDEELTNIRNYYDLPFRAHRAPMEVAVVGAGAGNDVAAALRARAVRIDAIEIDPVILTLGRINHPDQPYSQPEVTAIVDDARKFLKTVDRHYDVIVYGLVDSHTLLSHASSVRLDSFVYTLEGFRDARARLKDGGLIALSFALLSEELGGKIFRMLETAFDRVPPMCVEARYDRSVTFLQPLTRDSLAVDVRTLNELGFEDCTGRFALAAPGTDISTDDWPFFYMPSRTYPTSYLVMIVVMLAISLLLILRLSERPSRDHLTFFLLGAGFMLVETKAITELGLVFGNTWRVVGVAIAGILIMAFAANWLVQRWDVRASAIPYVLLLGSLALGVLMAQGGGLPPTLLGQLGTVAILTSPLLFSGLVFSALLSKEQDIAGAMSANLFGAMCGGLLEYNAMYFGFQFLYVLAGGLYAGAFLSSVLSPKRVSVPA